MILSLAFAGNDVCSGHNTTDSFTSLKEWKENIYWYLNWLDTKLPAGSHVTITGLVDGRILWNTLWNETHPINV